MNSRLEQQRGQKDILRVFYDPALRNWDACIREALAAHGIKDRLDVLVICEPRLIGAQNFRKLDICINQCATDSCFRAIGAQNYTKLSDRIEKWLDEEGLSEKRLKTKLMPLIDAFHAHLTKIFYGSLREEKKLSKKLKVSKQRIYDWAKKHEEFRDALSRAKDMQHEFLDALTRARIISAI